MPQTLAKPAHLTKSEYLNLRNRYLPENIKTIFILESPPASGRYFYNPAGSVNEPLFRAMMRDVLEIRPTFKEEGLKEFAGRGYFLIDATYTPVNHVKGNARDALILGDLPVLLEELKKYATAETGIVLVKTNVCKLLGPKLREMGFNVLNRSTVIPFPSSGQQSNFRMALRKIDSTRSTLTG